MVYLTRVRCAVKMSQEGNITQALDAMRMTRLLQVTYTANKKVVSECVATATLFESFRSNHCRQGFKNEQGVSV